MKGLKKVTLGAAIAAAPWLAYGTTPLDDAALSEVTGQAGVTIELDTRVTIDQIDYSQGPSTGSVLVNNIEIGGFGPLNDQITENLDIKIDIDLQENGDALLRFGPMGFNPVDLGVSVGSVGLSGSSGSATLISNFDMRMWVSGFDVLARVEDLQGNTGGSGSLAMDAFFAIENLDVDFDVAAVSLKGLRMGGPGSLEGTDSSSNGLIEEAAFPDTNSVRLALQPVNAQLRVGAAGSISASGPSETLRVQVDNFVSDIWMPTINVGSGDSSGAASIGSIAIDHLDISGTEMAIYGRQ
ncbi:hypothetical protein DES49_2607 [Halospina denitrificans]|uniref:DUF6160 domain-containing protein n=1 Tax=Halospina denitrificans TaxID=332522 RepID=A0A4R7JLT5_9GAMM|nr:DUF6160 family protein [Halospina denitrificans]TDT38624.1 hypothetical protein DES49_2607 [Halospina denitrificans]